VVVPLVFQHGAAGTVFTVTVVVWAAFEFVMRVRQRFLSRGPATVDRSAFILLPAMAGCVVLAEVLGRHGGLPWPGGLVWPFAAGMVLIVAGLGLRVWSIITLGRFFQYFIKVQPGHRVVTSGPYRFVRHPSYTGDRARAGGDRAGLRRRVGLAGRGRPGRAGPGSADPRGGAAADRFAGGGVPALRRQP